MIQSAPEAHTLPAPSDDVGFQGEKPTQSRLSGLRVGRYRLGARIGLGGAASVYLARSTGPGSSEQLVAVKIIHDHLTEESEFLTMFLDEANLASRLSHPNIVQVFELGNSDSRLFLAMEYLHGQPLSAVYRALVRRGGRLPWEIVAWIGARVADGLHHAHGLTDDHGQPLKLVHRDISPDNIFITYDGQVKVIDFGIARALHRVTTTAQGQIKGKYRYMAPEQALGRELDHRVDLFSLGATLLEAALGRPVFDAQEDTQVLALLLSGRLPDPLKASPDLPPELGGILLQLLSAEPDVRHPTASALAQELDAWVARGKGVAAQKKELRALMSMLFASEQRAEARAIGELRRLDPEGECSAPGLAVPYSSTPTVNSHSPTGYHLYRWGWPLVIALGLGLGISWLVAPFSQGKRASPLAAGLASEASSAAQSIPQKNDVAATSPSAATQLPSARRNAKSGPAQRNDPLTTSAWLRGP